MWAAKVDSHIFRVVDDGLKTLGKVSEANNEKLFSYNSTLLSGLFVYTLPGLPGFLQTEGR